MTPTDVMNAQPHAETTSCHLLATADSDDSDEESSQEEPPATSWNDLSIIERVGLNSVEMSETDVETAFSQITLAFRCDQYTLKQRLQAEEHARNLAEENIQLELSRGRETLEMLKGLCLDSKRSKILQRLELSMDILAGTVERISNTAEVLGAVHQEARVSRAVELMVAHMENLRRRHDKHEAELEEAKKMIQQQNPCRSIIDPSASPEPEESENRKRSSYQNSSRRRVSISLIPNQVQALQEKGKRDMKKKAAHGEMSSKTSIPPCPSPCMSSESSCSAMTKDDNYSVDDRPPDLEPPSEAAGSGALVPPDPSPVPNPDRQCPPPKEGTTTKTHLKSSPIATVRQRHKGKAALSKKRDKDKKRTIINPQTSVGIYGSLWRQRPLAHWLYRWRWPLLCLYLVVLLSVVTLICSL